MNKIEPSVLGVYFQNFFFIHLDSSIDFKKPNKFDNAKQLGTFIHEYIHFLQNISTTFGVKGLVCNFAKIRYYLYKVFESEDTKVNHNFKLSSEILDYSDTYEASLGDYHNIIYKYFKEIEILDISLYKKDDCYKKEYQEYLPPLLNLKLIDENNNVSEESLRFGAILIMESMAALFETHIYPQPFKVKQISYNICTIIWNFYIPELKNRFDLIFSVCDASLMDFNPGYAFIVVIKKYKNKLNSIDKIYNAFSETFEPNNMNLYEEQVNEMKRHLNNLICPNNSFYKPLNQYVTGFLDTIYKLRTEKISFLSERMSKKNGDNKKWISNFINNTKAIPLVINKDNTICDGVPYEGNKENMLYFLALYAFSNLFGIGGKKECYLSDICKTQIPDNYNDDCKNCPWKKGSEDILCPMGRIWSTFGLKNKELIY